MMFANLQRLDGTAWANFKANKDLGGDFGSGDRPDSSAEVGRIAMGPVIVRNDDKEELNVFSPDHQKPCAWASNSTELKDFFQKQAELEVCIGLDTYTQAIREQLRALFDALKKVPDLTLRWIEPDEKAVLALEELELSNLKELLLQNIFFQQTDAMCLALSNLLGLRSLSLIGEPSETEPSRRRQYKKFELFEDHEPFGDTGMRALAKLPNLRQLTLAIKLNIPDNGLTHFSDSPLQSLSLASTVPSQAGIAAISRIGGLEHLDLSYCHTAGLNFDGFRNLKNLIKLDLGGETRWLKHNAKPPTEHLADILKIPNLQNLVLNGMAFETDLALVRTGLRSGNLPRLRTLEIDGNKYTREQLVSPRLFR